MADNLNIINGEAAFFSVKELAWHKLGKVLDNPPTSEEAIKYAKLDYIVEKSELNVINVDKKLEGYYGTYRSDTNDILGFVGSRYEIVQNTAAFQFFDSVIGQGHACYETAGALGKGETIFVTAKLPDCIKIKGNDIIEKYLLFTSTHDGSGSIRIMLTPIRVVCNNTLNMALRNNSNCMTLKHTKNVHSKLEIGADIMGFTNQYYENMKDVLQSLTIKPIEIPQIKQVVFNTFLSYEEIKRIEDSKVNYQQSQDISSRKKTNIQNCLRTIANGVGQSEESCYINGKLSAYGLYNGINGYFNNVKSYKSEEDRFESLYGGSTTNINQKVFNMCLEI